MHFAEKVENMRAVLAENVEETFEFVEAMVGNNFAVEEMIESNPL